MFIKLRTISIIFFCLIGVIFFTQPSFAESIGERLAGKILIQVEEHGEAWYVFPNTLRRYYLGRPADAFRIMNELGLGVAHNELTGYLNNDFPTRLAGKIMLDVEANGEAYYVNPEDLRGYYLNRPRDAFDIMRQFGLGITNADLELIFVGVVGDIGAYKNPERVFTVMDTVQDRCYDDNSTILCSYDGYFTGQDAQYAGVQPYYYNNHDGTITSYNTGLMWTKNYFGKMSFVDAKELAHGLVLGGYNDWRLPTAKELYQLIDFRGGANQDINNSIPYINTDFFEFVYGDEEVGERFIDAQYWSATEYSATTMNGAETIFGVNFADGRIKGYPKYDPATRADKKMFVRFVRDGADYGKNNFLNHEDGTVSDLATGLMWQQRDNAQLGIAPNGGMNWRNALSYCENASTGGYDDWRLPNAKELQSIVDYSRSPKTTNSPAIDPIFYSHQITDENGNTNYPYYWTSTTHLEGGKFDQAVYIAFGEALGYMSIPPNSAPQLMDVHGAGAQRSDPKSGVVSDFAGGRGPQGDVVRIYNHVRCVR